MNLNILLILQQRIKKIASQGKWIYFPSIKKNTSDHDEIYTFAVLSEWSDKDKLEKEREVIGFYISSHPLEIYKKQLAWFAIESFQMISEKAKTAKGEYTTIGCGLLKTRKDIVTKKGDRMSFLQFEDMSGATEVIAFPKTFARAEKWLSTHHVFIIKGTVDSAENATCKIKAQDIIPIELVLSEWPAIEHITLTLPDHITEDVLINIKKCITKGNAPLHIIFHENEKKLRLTTKEKIILDAESVQLLELHDIIIQCAL